VVSLAAVWLSGSALISFSEVTLRQVQLVLEWVTAGISSQYVTSYQVNSASPFLCG